MDTCGRRRRIAEDVDSADLGGVSGTPTFFINGLRHYGGERHRDTERRRESRLRAREFVRPSA